MTSTDATHPETLPPRPARWGIGAAVGLVTAAVALGSAELVSGIDRRFASPVTQVGNRVIDAAPPWLKTFAIENFGTNDKAVLIGSVMVLLAVFAVALGILSRRHLSAATTGAALFGVLGAAAALAGVGGALAAVPSVVGGIVAVVAIRMLARRAWAPRLAGASSVQDEVAVESPTVHKATGEVDPPTTPALAGAPSRRAFLTVAAAMAVVGGAAAATGRQLRTRFDAAVDRAKVVLPRAKKSLPALDVDKYSAGVDGATPFITSNSSFYRVDTALEVPQVAIDSWKLSVKGLVDRPLTFTYDELLKRDLVEADVTLTCVSNEVGGHLAGTARWLGVPLTEILEEAGVRSSADQIVGRSVDGYTCGFPVDAVDGKRTALLVVGMNGEPLPVNHGFPARLLVAGLYGYVSATKWLSEIELTRFADFDQYWVPRGWDAKAPIKTLSRIDTPVPLGRIGVGRHPIAGVAWAQTRGISKVEVKVDDSPWTAAQLRPVPNKETWCQWVLPWDFAAGSHNITCRATDGTGATQTDERAAPRPNGASGWHSVVTLVG
ncbi:MAG: molybdopterin-dependent oxidoreductase [Acidimicrobiales bacterium]